MWGGKYLNYLGLSKLKRKDIDSIKYLSKIEKSLFKDGKIKSLNDQQVFIEFIRDSHNTEEIRVLINLLEKTEDRIFKFLSLTTSSATSLFLIIFTILSAMIVFILDTVKELAISGNLESVVFKDASNLAYILIVWWFIIYIIIIFFIWNAFYGKRAKNRARYLILLKSIYVK